MQTRTVRGVATKIRHDKQGTHVRYHNTDVVTIHTDRSVTLRTGGWRTSTTKARMNQAASQFGLRLHVYQKDYGWFVTSTDERWPWTVEFEGSELHIPCVNGTSVVVEEVSNA